MKMIPTILLTGCPGVGKSEVSVAIGARCGSAKLVVIDLDHIAQIFPFEPTEPFFSLVEANLRAVIPAYLKWAPDIILICGVMVPGALAERVQDVVRSVLTPTPRLIGLTAERDVIKQRIKGDKKPQDKVGRLQCLALDQNIRAFVPHDDITDTSSMTIPEVADVIFNCYIRPMLVFKPFPEAVNGTGSRATI
jgi:hypothetical protein